MFASGYVPGGVTGLLQNTTLKKKAKTNKEQDEKKTANLTELFSAPMRLVEDKSEKTEKTKKRKLSGSKVTEAETTEDSATPNAETLKRRKKAQFVDTVERRKRTVFVGNVPIECERKALKRRFKQFGSIEAVRFRSATPADMKTPKKLAVNRGEFHPNRSSMNAYIVFKDAEHAKAALNMNGEEFDSHHLRVDIAFAAKQHDHSRSVFVGNLPFDAENEDLRSHFTDCGAIENVRIIRDKKCGLGKGFGYIKFQDKSSVELALNLDGHVFRGRKLRVHLSKKQAPTDGKEQGSKKTPPRTTVKSASNATQASFVGEKADKIKQLKLKKQKKIKKQRESRQQKKMAKVLSADSKKDQTDKKQTFSRKIHARNRVAKKKTSNAK